MAAAPAARNGNAAAHAHTRGPSTPAPRPHAPFLSVIVICRKLGDVDTAIGLTDFGIPDHMHHAPIAQDWVAYNSFQNMGELSDAARESFQGGESKALLSKLLQN